MQVKTLESARQLIQWAKFHDVELQAIRWCGDYFDPDLRQIRVQKLPPVWMQSLKIAFTMLTFVAAMIGFLGMFTNDAVLKFKATDRWFLLKSDEAKVIWPFNAGSLLKSDCQANSRDNALRTSFAESEVQLLCTMFASPESRGDVQKTVASQRLIFAFSFGALLLVAWHWLWICIKGVVAKHLESRNLNPDVTGGQSDLNFDEK